MVLLNTNLSTAMTELYSQSETAGLMSMFVTQINTQAGYVHVIWQGGGDGDGVALSDCKTHY